MEGAKSNTLPKTNTYKRLPIANTLQPPTVPCGVRPEPHGRQASRTVGSDRPTEGVEDQTGARFGAVKLTWPRRLVFGGSRGLTLELRS